MWGIVRQVRVDVKRIDTGGNEKDSD